MNQDLSDYTTFEGTALRLRPWYGKRVALLLEPERAVDPAVAGRLLGILDRAHQYYATTVGRLPAPARTLDRRAVIAEVESTCGAGCSYIGATGMEIMRPYMDRLIAGVRDHDVVDQIPFYEFGRNFWFWSDALAFKEPEKDPVVTGFAVWMRFRSMDAAGVTPAPFDGTDFTEFRHRVEELVDVYDADTRLTFAGTLAQNRSPGAFGGTDFWASIMMRLALLYGGQDFVESFWECASRALPARSTAEAVGNWVDCASRASGQDLSPVFYDRWGFPRPDGTTANRAAARDVPFPR